MPQVAALAGGTGGSKLSHGLALALAPGELSVVVNTADDFGLWGLRICPDLDTVMYTLGGVANRETGWGVANETWSALDMLGSYGEDAWFKIGDRDLATHVLRTHLLAQGWTLTDATARLAGALGIGVRLLPMCEASVATLIETPDGPLDFQEYFVRLHHEPVVTGVTLRGIEDAAPTPGVLDTLRDADAVVLCPSNPIVSIGPILAVPGLREALRAAPAPKVAVSPIVGGQAVRGPADSMLSSLGHETSALGVARLYADVVQGMVIDALDVHLRPAIEALGVAVRVTDSIMKDDDDRRRLADETLELARSLSAAGPSTR